MSSTDEGIRPDLSADAKRRAKGNAASRRSQGARRLAAYREQVARDLAFERARDAVAMETRARAEEREARAGERIAAQEAAQAAREAAREAREAAKAAEREARMAESRVALEAAQAAQEEARKASIAGRMDARAAAAAARSVLLAVGQEMGGVRVRSEPIWADEKHNGRGHAVAYEVEFLVCGHHGRISYDNIRRRRHRGPSDPTHGLCTRCAQQYAGSRAMGSAPKIVLPAVAKAGGPEPGTPYHALEQAQALFAAATRYARGVQGLGRVPHPGPRPAWCRGA